MQYKRPGNFKFTIFKALSPKSPYTEWYYRIDDFFIPALILLNVVAIIVASYEEIYNTNKAFFRGFEIFSIIIFTIEYICRIWIADIIISDPSKAPSSLGREDFAISPKPLARRREYIFSVMGIIDLIAILPFYLPMLFHIDLRLLRILRLVRLFRIFKLAHYSSSLRLVGTVIHDRRQELIVTLFGTFLILVLTASFMYSIENSVQPDKFPNILSALWWAVATFTTIGYGDIYPVTGWGQLLAALTALFGIGLVAIPTGIISAGFLEELQKERSNDLASTQAGNSGNISKINAPINTTSNDYNYCPCCGHKLNDTSEKKY